MPDGQSEPPTTPGTTSTTQINGRHVENQAHSEVSATNSTASQMITEGNGEKDTKQQEKLRKLAAWKKKQEERKKLKEQEAQTKASQPTPPPPTKKTLLNTKPVLKQPTSKFGFKKAVVTKPSVFGDSDDEDGGRPVKKPRFMPTQSTSDKTTEGQPTPNTSEKDEVDPLDAFMTNLKDRDLEISNGQSSVTGPVDEQEGYAEDPDYVDENTEATELLKKLRSKKSKNIHVPKYDLKQMEPITKNFLVELETIDPDEVINFRVLNNIFINNRKINPVFNFFHFGLDAETLGVLTNGLRFEAPTPIQSQTIPAIMSGKDVIGIGKTGSGKTMCYLLSMLKHIKQQRPLQDGESGPLGLILSPTRELAIQIHETSQHFLKTNGLRSICCTGGSELKTQIADLKKGVEIIVATPGRFIDLLTLNNGKLLKTDRITFVTLDEADRLFDLGFEPQINQIMKTIRPDKQAVLFSATFPTKLQQFAVKILKKPVIIAVGNKQVVNENITQLGKVFANEDEKFAHLLQLLGKQEDEKTIIFCDSQIQVNHMNRRLSAMSYQPVCIHAGLPAHERTANLQLFKKSFTSNILICTEVLSRGLDVPEVSLVILYNAARTFAQYVHTTGRTARGNAKGTAFSLLSRDEDLQAYILYKCMPEEDVPEDIKDLALSFEKDMKAGKKKITAGFGGKGLDNLDKLRDETEKTERGKLGEEKEEKDEEGDDDGEETDGDKGPNLDIMYNVENVGTSPGTFNAKINTNDLPQDVRWVATNNITVSSVVEQTSVSVTFRGKFYPEGQEPKEGEEPKLFILVEAAKEQQLHDAIELFKLNIIQGLKKATKDRSGKFTM